MVKHTQAIFWKQPTNCLSEFDHFVGLALKGLKYINNQLKAYYRTTYYFTKNVPSMYPENFSSLNFRKDVNRKFVKGLILS